MAYTMPFEDVIASRPHMKIRVGKYDPRTRQQPTTPGFKNLLIHTVGPFTPFTLKDSEGRIHENLWQFAKIYRHVTAQNQGGSWVHPSEEHIGPDGLPTPAYWAWREKGQRNDRPVRYPNGFRGRSQCVCALWPREDGTPFYDRLDYIEARKRIYTALFLEFVRNQPEFLEVQRRVAAGEPLQINEVDGPTWAAEEPYCRTANRSIEINEDVIRMLINNPAQPFGHGYAFAVALMCGDDWVAPTGATLPDPVPLPLALEPPIPSQATGEGEVEAARKVPEERPQKKRRNRVLQHGA
eukprot:TRINITY_DN4636_c0_g1_i1.p1 TRINITY_DN4636_c0_g1~~TRINITY_DN4636_c0_g1_i1.p1  ORF type:complete len:296 (-),score=27.18 TRINITY_DN4636_c0_g1_i1:97-984(-)